MDTTDWHDHDWETNRQEKSETEHENERDFKQYD